MRDGTGYWDVEFYDFVSGSPGAVEGLPGFGDLHERAAGNGARSLGTLIGAECAERIQVTSRWEARRPEIGTWPRAGAARDRPVRCTEVDVQAVTGRPDGERGWPAAVRRTGGRERGDAVRLARVPVQVQPNHARRAAPAAHVPHANHLGDRVRAGSAAPLPPGLRTPTARRQGEQGQAPLRCRHCGGRPGDHCASA